MRNNADIWKPASASLGAQYKVVLTGKYGEVARMSPADLVTWSTVGTGATPPNANGNLWPAAVAGLPSRFKVLLVGAYGETARMSASDLVAQFGIVGTARAPGQGIAGKNLWPPAFSTLPPRFRVVLTGNAGQTATMSIDNVVTAGGGGDPSTAFIASLLAYSPDVLLVGDKVTTASVTSWPDSSGHGASAAPTAGATAPSRHLATVNGRNSVLFNGTTNELEGAFVNNTAFSSVFVVYRNPVPSNGQRYVSTAAAAGGVDASVGQPVLIYCGSDSPAQTNAYVGAPGGRASSAANQFRLGVAITDGANSNVYDQGATQSANPYTGPMATALYCLGSNSGLGGGFPGDIAFVMLFKANKESSRAAISTIINTYYGL
jgi:hypothetical protein